MEEYFPFKGFPNPKGFPASVAQISHASDKNKSGSDVPVSLTPINFLYIAKGSCGEVRSQLNKAFDVGFISKETYNQMYNDCRKLSAGILNFIKSLKVRSEI